MRKENLNKVNLQGYVYDVSKLSKKVTGAASKNPGTEFYTGEISIAVDEEGLNVIPVHFTYVTATYASGKPNRNYEVLGKLVDNPNLVWISGSKETAMKVEIQASCGLNNFFDREDNRVSAKRVEGSFITQISAISDNPSKQNRFDIDMVITKTTLKEANPEIEGSEDYLVVSGIAFDYGNHMLPIELNLHNKLGIDHFMSLGINNSNILFTKVSGKILNQTIKVKKVEETAWSGDVITYSERKTREWAITEAAKIPYDFGDEAVLTEADLVKCQQDWEIMWAEIKKRNDDYKASQTNSFASPSTATKTTGGFNFNY